MMCKEAIGDDELSVERQLCTAPEYGVGVFEENVIHQSIQDRSCCTRKLI